MRDLRMILNNERKQYMPDSCLSRIKLCLLCDHNYLIWRYVRALRITEYHYNKGHSIRYWIYQRRKNILGSKLGITIWHNTVGEGLKIWHYGSIVINGHAKIGKNCQLHGENCIGNKGDFDNRAPVLGDNVDVGIGAKIIGDIYIADDVRIGANAVVTKSCNTKGAVLVGIPAKKLPRKE